MTVRTALCDLCAQVLLVGLLAWAWAETQRDLVVAASPSDAPR